MLFAHQDLRQHCRIFRLDCHSRVWMYPTIWHDKIWIIAFLLPNLHHMRLVESVIPSPFLEYLLAQVNITHLEIIDCTFLGDGGERLPVAKRDFALSSMQLRSRPIGRVHSTACGSRMTQILSGCMRIRLMLISGRRCQLWSTRPSRWGVNRALALERGLLARHLRLSICLRIGAALTHSKRTPGTMKHRPCLVVQSQPLSRATCCDPRHPMKPHTNA